jgi:Bacterial regulatory protein, Fis family
MDAAGAARGRVGRVGRAVGAVGRRAARDADTHDPMCTLTSDERLEYWDGIVQRAGNLWPYHRVSASMPDTLALHTMPAVFSPLAKALLDGFSEGVVVFDVEGRLLYANNPAREALVGMDLSEGAPDLQPRLAALGGRLRPLRVGGLELGEAMFIPGVAGPTTLAAREKEAIVKTLDSNNWKLAETARSLGISRTTLWRRLKAYGLHRDGRSKWAQTS